MRVISTASVWRGGLSVFLSVCAASLLRRAHGERRALLLIPGHVCSAAAEAYAVGAVHGLDWAVCCAVSLRIERWGVDCGGVDELIDLSISKCAYCGDVEL